MAFSCIFKRTAFADMSENKVRFLDWLLVQTSIGQAVMPRQLSEFPIGNKVWDCSGEFTQIDRLETGADWKNQTGLFGGLIGGDQVPKLG